MKKVFFAATAIFFASCNNSQQPAESQATIDSMSQVLLRQHIIDSLEARGTVTTDVGETTVNVMQSNGSSSGEPRRSNSSGNNSGGTSRSGNQSPAGNSPGTATPSTAGKTVSGPTAAEIEAKRKADNRKKAKSAATGALIGAGAGAVGGAISGKNDHFKKENAAIGAGAGAVLGAGAGLLLQNRKLKKEREEEANKTEE